MAEKKRTFTRTNPITGTVGTTPTQILNADPKRIEIIIVNHSPYDGRVANSDRVSTSYGYFIPGAGGTLILSYETDRDLVKDAFWAINEVTAGTWFIQEVVEE